jgi:hypothetical protein
MATFIAPNGEHIVGSYEMIPCAVGIIDINMETGEPEYDGTGATLYWDDQAQQTREGARLYLDETGTAWPVNSLTRVEKKESPAAELSIDDWQSDVLLGLTTRGFNEWLALKAEAH